MFLHRQHFYTDFVFNSACVLNHARPCRHYDFAVLVPNALALQGAE